jgi:CHASE1-domain containing sensor protein
MDRKTLLILMTVLLSSTFVSAFIYSQSLQQSNSQFGNLKTPSYSKSILKRKPSFLRFGLCVTAGALVTAFFDKSAAFSLRTL